MLVSEITGSGRQWVPRWGLHERSATKRLRVWDSYVSRAGRGVTLATEGCLLGGVSSGAHEGWGSERQVGEKMSLKHLKAGKEQIKILGYWGEVGRGKEQGLGEVAFE